MPGLLKSNLFPGKQKAYNAVHHLCSVKFLDNSDSLSVTYERNTKGRFLLDHVCSSIDLIERDYFGLKYTDAYKQECWLDPEKTIHSQIKDLSNPQLFFQVKFYPSELDSIKEEITRYQLFLQVRKDFNDSKLICDLEKALRLAAYVVQDEVGDYSEADEPLSQVTRVKLPPALDGYQGDVSNIHRQLMGMKQSGAEYKFLSEASALDSYGIDPYIVSDEAGVPMYLAISPRGIMTLEDNQPTRIYLWKDIWKLSFDGKTFHIRTIGEEKGSRKKSHKNVRHFGTGFFACTSANKRPLQQTTTTYKCLSHANCKQLWKNAVANKYFYTLEKSSDAPKVLTSGGLFTRGSKFRYSGNCLEEIRRSSASINREEPQVYRQLSSVQVNREGVARCSTLPHRWKPKKSLREADAPKSSLASCTSQDVGTSEMMTNSNNNNSPIIPNNNNNDNKSNNNQQQHFARKTSSDSALEIFPSTSDQKNPENLSKSEKLSEGELETFGFNELSSEPRRDRNEPPVSCDVGGSGLIPAAAAENEKKTEDGDDDVIDSNFRGTGGDETPKMNLDITGSPAGSDFERAGTFSRTDYDGGDLIDFSANDSQATEDGVSCCPPETETARAKPRERKESGSACDTGYASGGSEMTSRSFESDEVGTTIARSSGILEEMEFPPEAGNDGSGGAAAADCGPLVREQLLSMLSYGADNLTVDSTRCDSSEASRDSSGFVDSGRSGLDGHDSTGMSTSTLRDLSPFSQSSLSSSSSIVDRNKTSPEDSSLPSLCPPPYFRPSSSASSSSSSFVRSQLQDQRSLLSGVFSSDNFKRIKEIEQMIEDNKNKILLMKEAISSEIRRSNNSSSNNINHNNNNNNSSSNTRSMDLADLPPKPPKRVSFSSRDVQWHERGASYANLGFNNNISSSNNDNDNDQQQSSYSTKMECVEDPIHPPTRHEPQVRDYERRAFESAAAPSSFVEKIPADHHSIGSLVAQVEFCRLSPNEDDGDDDASEATGVGKSNEARLITCEDILNESVFNNSSSSNNNNHEILRSEGSGGTIYMSLSRYCTEPTTKQPVVENKVEQFSFSETVVEEVVKLPPEIFEAISLSIHGSSAAAARDSSAPDAKAAPEGEEVEDRVSSMEDNVVEETKDMFSVSKKLESSKEGHVGVVVCGGSRGRSALCRGLVTTFLSTAMALILFVAVLVVVFETEQRIPYVTEQESFKNFKEVVYEPARKKVMKLFRQ